MSSIVGMLGLNAGIFVAPFSWYASILGGKQSTGKGGNKSPSSSSDAILTSGDLYSVRATPYSGRSGR